MTTGHTAIFACLGALALAACAATPEAVRAPGPPMVPLMQLALPVPADHGPQRVEVVTREIAPGASIPWHTHAGTEIATVVSGEMETLIAGQAPERVTAGGYVKFDRGVVHSARNPGTVPARLAITYILDRDAPQREPADPPQNFQ